jgi:hypothetical protein
MMTTQLSAVRHGWYGTTIIFCCLLPFTVGVLLNSFPYQDKQTEY